MPDGFTVAPARLRDARPELARAATRLREAVGSARPPLAAASEAATGQAPGPAIAALAHQLELAMRATAERLDQAARSLARGADGYHEADRAAAQTVLVR